MTDKLKPTKEQEEDAEELFNLWTHVGTGPHEIALFLLARDQRDRRTPDARLEAERAVIEAANEVAAGWLNGRTISGERDSMNKLINALAALDRSDPKPSGGFAGGLRNEIL